MFPLQLASICGEVLVTAWYAWHAQQNMERLRTPPSKLLTTAITYQMWYRYQDDRYLKEKRGRIKITSKVSTRAKLFIQHRRNSKCISWAKPAASNDKKIPGLSPIITMIWMACNTLLLIGQCMTRMEGSNRSSTCHPAYLHLKHSVALQFPRPATSKTYLT